jgi:predicted metal-dependent RNase
VVVINRAEILCRYRKHISNVSLKISRSLELLRVSYKSFCVQVPVLGDFKEVGRSFIYEVKRAEILRDGSKHSFS